MIRVETDPPVITMPAEKIRRAVQSAQRLAVSTATRQTGSAARKTLRDQTGILARRLKRRVFNSVRSNSGSVWVGLNSWPAGWFTPLTPRAPNPDQQAELPGAFARDFFFAGGFVARMPSGHVGIFKRTGRKTGTGRQEIREQTISADVLGLSGVERRLKDIAEQTLEREFIRQMDRQA